MYSWTDNLDPKCVNLIECQALADLNWVISYLPLPP